MEIDDVREILPLFLHHSHAAVAIKSANGSYLFANREYARYAGVDHADLCGRRDEQFMPRERLIRAQRQEEAALETGRGCSADESFVVDGKATAYLTARFPILGENHRIMALGIIAMEVTSEQRDIAEAERALKAAQQANAQLRSAIFTLEELASTDRLTSAWNRRRFEETIEGEADRAARYGHPLAMLLIDIDHFKRINDTFGHSEGDRVLVLVSDRIRAMMRKSDSLTRWGGEEFIVLMPNTWLSRARTSARRICETIAAGEIKGIGKLTVSIGVAEYLPTESWPEWLERADRAMYRAKESGRNRVVEDPTRSKHQRAVEHLEGSFVQLLWKDSFRCGHALIDAQHESLFERANELLEGVLSGRPRDELLAAIDTLMAEVGEHFRDEERILESLGFANLEAHIGEHVALMARGKGLLDAFKADQNRSGDVFQFLAYELVTRHVLGADREYFPLIAAKPPEEETGDA